MLSASSSSSTTDSTESGQHFKILKYIESGGHSKVYLVETIIDKKIKIVIAKCGQGEKNIKFVGQITKEQSILQKLTS
jgi:serine/threonine protein kinase